MRRPRQNRYRSETQRFGYACTVSGIGRGTVGDVALLDLVAGSAMVNAALPWLETATDGSIVFLSSVSGREVDMFAEPYGSLKAALLHSAKGLSVRLAPEGIRVNTVSPGNVYFPDGVWGRIERDTPDVFAQCLAANPMGRMARPDEVAKSVLFLASQAASFTTGTSLLVDGGLTSAVQF